MVIKVKNRDEMTFSDTDVINKFLTPEEYDAVVGQTLVVTNHSRSHEKMYGVSPVVNSRKVLVFVPQQITTKISGQH